MSMKNRGFTLIELMITLAVMAILLSWAVPSFQEIIRQNRLTTDTNDLVTALNLARSEAIKRGRTVTVTPSGGDWGAGWTIATTDSDGNAITLRVGDGVSGSMSMTGGAATFSFDASGFRNDGNGASQINVCDSDSSKGRQISISVIGRPSVDSAYACS
jgi:type IV fimbrial biogenesis protein FimT